MNARDLRDRLRSGAPLLLPGVWDALSARLAREQGFGFAFVSGFCVSAATLGLPDAGYLTQTEMARVAGDIHRASPEMGLVVDADTGYGNARNVLRTCELWHSAGAVGLFLEDQVWPKRCGHMVGKQVVDRDEWLGKLRAAVEADVDLFVTARTDARAPHGLDEAIERARAARDVGVDAVFVEAPRSIEELEAIAAGVAGPVLVANMVETGATPLLTPAELHELGFDLIVAPVGPLFAATAAMRTAYGRLATAGTLRDHLDDLVDFDTFGAIVDRDRHLDLDRRYGGDGHPA